MTSNIAKTPVIAIKKLLAYMNDSEGTRITEKARFIEYRTKDIHCKARICIDTSSLTTPWSFGFVQGCTYMDLIHIYGRSGISKWEFHPLKSGRYTILSDCDGEQWPFYSEAAMRVIYPTEEIKKKGIVSFNIHLEDYFTPNTVWDVSHGGKTFDKLNEIFRRQGFTVWLVAIKNNAGISAGTRIFYTPGVDELFVLRNISWSYSLRITINCTRPLGERAHVTEDQTEQPTIDSTASPIPLHTLFPPCCNDAQSLIWYPAMSAVPYTVVVLPKEILVDWKTWLHEMVPEGRPIILPHVNVNSIKKVSRYEKERVSGIITEV